MNRLFWVILVSLSSLSVHILANAETLTVERVRYCTGGKLFDNKCIKGETSDKFTEWADHSVDKARQKNTYIAFVSKPDIANVKHVVFISAGQQTAVKVNPDGYQNVLTGQPANYKRDCNGKTKSCDREFNSNSLAMRLKNSGMYNMDETLFVIVLDSQYNYYEEDKQRLVDTYWDFLAGKFYPTSVQDIVLAGQSRGGCLSLRLAQKFRSNPQYKNIPLILQLNDAVCRNNGKEVPHIESSKSFAINPLDNKKKKKSILVDMAAVFPNSTRTNLYIHNIHAGGKVGNLPIRALTYKKGNTDIGWWRQTWVNFEHTTMGGDFGLSFYTVEPAYLHIINSLKEIRYGMFKPTTQAPVDINGDGLSDIVTFEPKIDYRDNKYTTVATLMKVALLKSNGIPSWYSKDIALDDHDNESHPITPFLAGYFSNDRKTDIVRIIHNKQQGLVIKTFISGDNHNFIEKTFISGDGYKYYQYPVLVGDVNRDGLSDILIFWRDPQKGLMVRTKFSKGDGQYRNVTATLGDDASVDILPILAADINGDSMTDIILQSQDNKGHKIRTKISNGDGTFTAHEFGTGDWLYWQHDRFLVGDINKDRKSDLVRVFYDKTKGLSIHTFITRGDGTFDVKRQVLGDTEPGYSFPTHIADLNGDRQSDIILRHRNSNNELIINAKISNGNGTYRSVWSNLGTDETMDAESALIGTYDRGKSHDIVFTKTIRKEDNTLRSTDTLWAKAGQTNGTLRNLSDDQSPEHFGFGMPSYSSLSGPLSWNGQGGTFPICRPPICEIATAVQETSSAPIATDPRLIINKPKPSNGSIEIKKPGVYQIR